jgi:D-alanyl-D-alanine carboxypeptidase
VPTSRPTAKPTPWPTPRPTPKPTAKPTREPTQPAGALPACRYDDVLTARRAYGDWATSLLDTIYRLPSGYYPGDLVDASKGGITTGYKMRSLVVNDMRALTDAARAAGVRIGLVSAFRSYAQQEATFAHWVRVAGYETALRTSARPGHSEHQLGTAFDFSIPGAKAPWEYSDWATTATGKWLKANAWKYGFVMSYPKGKSALTCYDYEPWHYRYVGRDLAAQITKSGQTPREFLWRVDH